MVATVRRLDRLLPSAWQERVKSRREVRTYDQFLREVLFREEGSDASRTFWRNHGLEGTLNRWRPAIAPEQVTLVVADETDREQLLRTFERLLGLPDQLLTPGPWKNTSLSYDRVELYRRVNQACRRAGTERRRLAQVDVLRSAPRAAEGSGGRHRHRYPAAAALGCGAGGRAERAPGARGRGIGRPRGR